MGIHAEYRPKPAEAFEVSNGIKRKNDFGPDFSGNCGRGKQETVNGPYEYFFQGARFGTGY